jgi:hypothetical protein
MMYNKQGIKSMYVRQSVRIASPGSHAIVCNCRASRQGCIPGTGCKDVLWHIRDLVMKVK